MVGVTIITSRVGSTPDISSVHLRCKKREDRSANYAAAPASSIHGGIPFRLPCADGHAVHCEITPASSSSTARQLSKVYAADTGYRASSLGNLLFGRHDDLESVPSPRNPQLLGRRRRGHVKLCSSCICHLVDDNGCWFSQASSNHLYSASGVSLVRAGNVATTSIGPEETAAVKIEREKLKLKLKSLVGDDEAKALRPLSEEALALISDLEPLSLAPFASSEIFNGRFQLLGCNIAFGGGGPLSLSQLTFNVYPISELPVQITGCFNLVDFENSKYAVLTRLLISAGNDDAQPAVSGVSIVSGSIELIDQCSHAMQFTTISVEPGNSATKEELHIWKSLLAPYCPDMDNEGAVVRQLAGPQRQSVSYEVLFHDEELRVVRGNMEHIYVLRRMATDDPSWPSRLIA
ncbi:hypothetical protein CBR_g22356 [Chara braunii]|uniref:Plastid lipid-associated protein/fibrillin conserved domain-containing protein n=1 Tax=Chara braunii TaxID=69332 RepID=A0A388JUR5_CHABU|nr:hypothetical protein CBR_g22356 [Chara braunii]|eukprot:GBG61559.1 hypothetical protein CBR_g22356 [Chara braunii]